MASRLASPPLDSPFDADALGSGTNRLRDPYAGRQDGVGQPVVGRTAHSWRISQTGRRRIGTNRVEAASRSGSATVANVADVPDQSSGRDGVDGFLYRPDGDRPHAVRAGLAVAPTPAHRLLNIAEHPTASWAAQQVVEAFPGDTTPQWLLRDRDSIYGDVFRRRVAGMGIAEVICSPASPWQNPYAERVIGSIRRECLDHVIVFGEVHLRRLLSAYVAYYHGSRTHLGLGKDTPDGRPVQPASAGRIVAIPEVGGLHHRYERRAA